MAAQLPSTVVKHSLAVQNLPFPRSPYSPRMVVGSLLVCLVLFLFVLLVRVTLFSPCCVVCRCRCLPMVPLCPRPTCSCFVACLFGVVSLFGFCVRVTLFSPCCVVFRYRCFAMVTLLFRSIVVSPFLPPPLEHIFWSLYFGPFFSAHTALFCFDRV